MDTEKDFLTTSIKNYRADLYAIMSEYDASNLRVFGSVAMHRDRLGRDVDFIVDVKNPPRGRLFARAGLSKKFSRILGRPVDIVLGDDNIVLKLDQNHIIAI